MAVSNLRIQVRRDTASNWSSVNPVLLQGEQGLETDTGKVKYGNGSTSWNDLEYQKADAIVETTNEFNLEKFSQLSDPSDISHLAILDGDNKMSKDVSLMYNAPAGRLIVNTLAIPNQSPSTFTFTRNSAGELTPNKSGVGMTGEQGSEIFEPDLTPENEENDNETFPDETEENDGGFDPDADPDDQIVVEPAIAGSYNTESAVSVNGYYPLYESESEANSAGNGTSHSHTFDGITYYMPNGVDFYHGNYVESASALSIPQPRDTRFSMGGSGLWLTSDNTEWANCIHFTNTRLGLQSVIYCRKNSRSLVIGTNWGKPTRSYEFTTGGNFYVHQGGVVANNKCYFKNYAITTSWSGGALEVRNNRFTGSSRDRRYMNDRRYAPGLSFHWSHVRGGKIYMNNDGTYWFTKNNYNDMSDIYVNRVRCRTYRVGITYSGAYGGSLDLLAHSGYPYVNISYRGLKMNRGDIYKGNDRYATEKEMRAIIKSMIDDAISDYSLPDEPLYPEDLD